MTNVIELMCLSIHKVISKFTDDAWYLSKLLVALGLFLNVIILAHKLGFPGVETQEQWIRLLIFTLPIGLLYLVVNKFTDQNKLNETAKEMLSKHQYKGEILNLNKVTRDQNLPDLPAEIVMEAFNLSIGEGTVISGNEESFILRLKNISDADLSSDTAKLLVSQLKNQINNSLSADLFESFANMARVNSKLDLNEQALNAVHSSFQ